MGSTPRSDGSQQAAAAVQQPGATQQPTQTSWGRDELATMMGQPQQAQSSLAAKIQAETMARAMSRGYGAQGTYAGMGGGASYTGGMPMRR